MKGRNRWQATGLALLLLAAGAGPAQAAASEPAYPTKPVRFLVPFVPGGGTDLTARVIAQKLGEVWGQQVIVDNRPGAAGTIAVELTANATPDGYTLCFISASHTVNAAINPKLPYDLTRDLTGLSQATSLFYVITVNPSVPARTLKELIAYAKAHPGKLNFGSSGTGGLQHFAGELFAYVAGIKIVHVPYKGGAASVAAAASGETQIAFTTLTSAGPHIRAGRLRPLAITGGSRTPAAPDLPTAAEAGLPGYEVDQWYGVVTSAKVNRALVRKLSAAIAAAVKSPEVAKRLAAEGSTPVGSDSEAFSAHIRSEVAKWRKLVQEAGLKMQ